MNQIFKALINFSKKSDKVFRTLVEIILLNMVGNANFENPTPSLAAIQETFDLFISALNNAASKDRTAIALKNQYRYQLELQMAQLGLYVNTTCMGDLAKLNSSGFPVSKGRELRIITKPENLKAVPGANTGSVVLKSKAVKGSGGYMHQIAKDNGTNELVWVSVSTSRCKYTFTELEQGKKYWMRIAALGSRDQVVYSDIISQYIL